MLPMNDSLCELPVPVHVPSDCQLTASRGFLDVTCCQLSGNQRVDEFAIFEVSQLASLGSELNSSLNVADLLISICNKCFC